jgi:predicted transcriptional regulator
MKSQSRQGTTERVLKRFAEEKGLVKRGWSKITAEILEAVSQPERKMRIMYRTNLNFDRFDRYFNDLLEKGFIEKSIDADGHPTYKISERGKTLLAAIEKVYELFSPASS